MSVQSRDLNYNPSSHVVTAEQLGKAEPHLRRGIAALLWLFSYTGNVLAFGGGWEAIHLDRALLAAIVASLVYQAVCTGVQFVCCQRWWNPFYLIALGASGIPSFIGYRLLIAVPLSEWVTGRGGDALAQAGYLIRAGPAILVWALVIHSVIFVGLVAVDIIPERVFVKH